MHSGADLQAAAKNAGNQLPGSAKGHLGYVLASRGSTQVRIMPFFYARFSFLFGAFFAFSVSLGVFPLDAFSHGKRR